MILHSPIDYRQLKNSCRYFFMFCSVCRMHAADFFIFLTFRALSTSCYRQSFPHDLPCLNWPVSRSVLHLVRLMFKLTPTGQSPLLPVLRPFYHADNAAISMLCLPFRQALRAIPACQTCPGIPFHIPSTHSASVQSLWLHNFCIKKVQHRAFTLCAVPRVKEKEEQ